MNKDLIGKIDTFMNSKGLVLCLLFLLLVLIPILFSLGYSNTKLEEQIFERDVYIRNLQYSDSIAKELLDYVETDSTRVLVTCVKNGHRMSYKEIAEERDSLELTIEAYKNILKTCKERFLFDYKIYYDNDSVLVSEVIFYPIK